MKSGEKKSGETIFFSIPFSSARGGLEIAVADAAAEISKFSRPRLFTASRFLKEEFRARKIPAHRIFLEKINPVSKLAILLFPFSAISIFLPGFFILLFAKLRGARRAVFVNFAEKILLAPLAQLLNFQTFFLEHETPRRWFRRNPFLPFYKFAARRATVIFPSQFLRDEFLKICPNLKTGILPNKVEPEFSGVSWRAARKVLDLSSRKIFEKNKTVFPEKNSQNFLSGIRATNSDREKTQTPDNFSAKNFRGDTKENIARGKIENENVARGSFFNFQKKIWFGFAGRFSEEKNLEKLIATFFELQKMRDDFILILAGGDSISRQKLIQKIPPEIRGRIFLPGFLHGEKLRDFFCALDFFLLFSKFESFSIAAVEALFYGKPILCAPVGVLPEIIRENENGFFLNLENSPTEIAAKIDAILRGENWREMEFFARKSVQKFSAKNFANRVREIFA